MAELNEELGGLSEKLGRGLREEHEQVPYGERVCKPRITEATADESGWKGEFRMLASRSRTRSEASVRHRRDSSSFRVK